MTIKKLVREIPIKKSERQHIEAIVKPMEAKGFMCEVNSHGINVFAFEECDAAINQG